MPIIIFPLSLREKIVEKSNSFSDEQIFYENKLLFNYEEIEKIKRNHEKNFLKILYFNKENIHNILYISEKTINIEDNQTKKISNLFYLDLLIADNPNIINYIFSINSIEILYEQFLSIREIQIKLILAKLLIDMIESYDLTILFHFIFVEPSFAECESYAKSQVVFSQFTYCRSCARCRNIRNVGMCPLYAKI